MFCVLLIPRVCFCLSCAAFWQSGAELITCSHLIVFCLFPKRSSYGRNAASPAVLFYFFAAPPGAAARSRRGRDFSDLFFASQLSRFRLWPSAPADYDVLHVRKRFLDL